MILQKARKVLFMKRKTINIISIFLLIVFLLPSFVKLEHHHEHERYTDNKDSRIKLTHEKCFVCNFEFSIFSSNSPIFLFKPETQDYNYSSNFHPQLFYNHLEYSFLLRAPPVEIVNS